MLQVRLPDENTPMACRYYNENYFFERNGEILTIVG